MRALEEQEVLRVNCPGFGTQSYFGIDYAGPFQYCNVIIVNPTSILHLFDKDPKLLSQIEEAQAAGSGSYQTNSDEILKSVIPDLETRTKQLEQFLQRGGLLIYFLCPPFVINGPSIALDNYLWLGAFTPDNSNEKNKRNMSSAARGKNIDIDSNNLKSPFAKYLKQSGLEWTTLLRTERLAAGYTGLATAGPNKIIAGVWESNDHNGKIVFLPAPYKPEFDKRLIESINLWLDKEAKISPPIRKFTASKPNQVDSCYSDCEPTQSVPSPMTNEVPLSSNQEPVSNEPPSSDRWSTIPPPPDISFLNEESTNMPSDDEFMLAQKEATGIDTKSEPSEHSSESIEASIPPSNLAPEEPIVEKTFERPAVKAPPNIRIERKLKPKEPTMSPEPELPTNFMNKMEEISKSNVPDWCQQYSFSDLDNMRKDLRALNEQIKLTQSKITQAENRISTTEWLKNCLLSQEGDELHRACSKVLETLGWGVQQPVPNKGELHLLEGELTKCIVQIVRSNSQVKRGDLAQLAESIITYWGEYETEPKGILIASTWANRPPSERTDPDFPDPLIEFARHKNLCVMTTFQLLCIYRDIEGGKISSDELRQKILDTNGHLAGFMLDPSLAGVG